MIANIGAAMEDVHPGPAYFDPVRGAWVLSGYVDVRAALGNPHLVIPGTDAEPHAAQAALKKAAAHELSRAQIAALRATIEAAAHEQLLALPTAQPVDLVRAFAEPWALALAVKVTGASAVEAPDLAHAAREVFLEAANAAGPDVPSQAQAAVVKLARSLQGAGASLGVQAFVALSQTLPCLLASSWGELFRHPEQIEYLRAEPERMPQAVEEMLRCASPARAVFRRARAEVRINGTAIGAGELAILMLAAANHDPARFPEPDRLNFARRTPAHLALGSGPYACSGAQMVRMAVAVATGALLSSADVVEMRAPEQWIGGFAIRAPAELRVVLHRRLDSRSPLLES